MEFTCPECGTSFDADWNFGEDVQCSHCKAWLATEYDVDNDEDGENYYAWITGRSENQRT